MKNNPRNLSVFDKHKIKIAKSTLNMSDIGARIMGGMTKQEARDVLRKFGISFKENPAKKKVNRNALPGTKYYVGLLKHSGKVEVFPSLITPTQKTHGARYQKVTGPFDTIDKAQAAKKSIAGA